ncbi:MAG: putative porin [Verrucomicrobia bacterium]|nr:putative porin [Verrucomicrobiota bacterium]
MKCRNLSLLTFACMLALTAGLVSAQDNQALLDALVRKGVLSQKEADQVMSEAAKEATSNAPLSKVTVGDWVDELKLSGDIRLRFQYNASTPQLPPAPNQTNYPGTFQQDRWRFRLRLNADVKLKDGWFAGVQLQTTQASDSANQTFTQGYDNYNIYISKAFLGWSGIPGITLIGGKQANPFYTTDLVWDPDITPQGFVERIDFHKFFNMSFGEAVADGKAPPPPAPAPEKPSNALEVSLIAGQFIFYDNNEYNLSTIAGNISNDSWQFETQLLTRLKLGQNFSATFAPAIFFTNNANAGTAGNPSQALLNSKAYNGNLTEYDLFWLQLPGDITFKVFGVPTTLYWDFAYNFRGASRWDRVYGPIYSDVVFNRAGTQIVGFSNIKHPDQRDRLSWLVGLRIGQNKKAGDLSLFGDFRQVGLAATDPNTNDSDFALSNLNIQGFKFGIAYNITDFVTAAVTGYICWNLDQNLYGGAANTFTNLQNGIASDNTDQVVQVDLQIRF